MHNVEALSLEGGVCKRAIYTVELQDHFDVLSADMRMENKNKIKVKNNVQSVETKFYCDLRPLWKKYSLQTNMFRCS